MKICKHNYKLLKSIQYMHSVVNKYYCSICLREKTETINEADKSAAVFS